MEKFQCGECDRVYIGHTKRCLFIRTKEYEKQTEKNHMNPEKDDKIGQCALADHFRQTEHTIDFDRTSILSH